MPWSSGSVRRALDATLLILGLALAGPGSAQTAYVTCQNGEVLSVIDLARGVERARWPLPGKPAGVAVTGAALYTVSPDSKTVRRLDTETGATLAETMLDGGPIATAERDADRVTIFDVKTLAIVAQPQVGTRPFGLRLRDNGEGFDVED